MDPAGIGVVADSAYPADQLTIVDFAFSGAEWVREPTFWREEFTEALRLYGAEEEPVPPKPELMLLAVRESDIASLLSLDSAPYGSALG